MAKEFTSKEVIMIASAILAVVLLITIFPANNLFTNVPITKSNIPAINPVVDTNAPIKSGTFVNTTAVFVTKSNTTAIQNALDSAGCQNNQGICALSSNKMLIQVNSVLFDSNQKQYPSSTYINIPAQSFLPTSLSWLTSLSFTGSKTFPVYSNTNNFLDNVHALSLTDQQGHLLDLGSVQVVFNAVVPNDGNVIAYGDYAVYLDDQLRQQGHFAGQGVTKNQQLLLAINNLPALTFTFSNEGANWQNGTQHIYRIMIGNVTGTSGTGTNSNSYQLTKTSIAYILVMTLNNNKKTIIGADNQAITIFNTDDSINVCGKYATLYQQQVGAAYVVGAGNYYISQVGGYGVPLTTASINGFVIGQINPISPDLGITAGTYSGENVGYIYPNAFSNNGKPICGHLPNVPRNSIILLQIGSKQLTLQTPVTQSDITIDANTFTVSGAMVIQ